MKSRVSGTVYRGEAVYYTFQRLTTGVDYLNRLEGKGKNLKDFRVVFSRDGQEKEMSGTKFRTWASGLKSEAAPATASKPRRRRKAAAEAEPAE